MKDVAIIIINYNSSRFTLECIQSVIDHTSADFSYQIIVVDNNSEVDQRKILEDQFPTNDNISLHLSNINTGFGGGNMFGAQFANAKYLLFLNNDAMLINDCVGILYAYMENHKDVGVCTAQNYDEHDNFVPSFDHNKGLRRLILGRGLLEKSNPSRYPKRDMEYNTPIEVDWVNGAFLFFSNEAFSKIQGFDTNIFLYWEEMDLCHRLRSFGYKSFLCPQAKILHYQGASISPSKIINKESYISYLYVVKKNFGYTKYFFIRNYLIFICILKPKKRYLLDVILNSNRQSMSLKSQQRIRLSNEN